MSQAIQYQVRARSTEVFGRVLCSSRDHHFVIDGPVSNGCPGEAVTPVEQFLSSVAACAVELVEVIARDEKTPLTGVSVLISTSPARRKVEEKGVTILDNVAIEVEVGGVSRSDAEHLVERFKGR